MGQDPKGPFSLLHNGMEQYQASLARSGEMLIHIDGQDFVFETKNRKAELKAGAGPAPKTRAWIITRENGFPLFALRPAANDKPFRVLTAKQLYSEGLQWFEPLADNYRELIRVHPNSATSG